jgi:hypothetical protein
VTRKNRVIDMTVQQLIEALQKLDPRLPVVAKQVDTSAERAGPWFVNDVAQHSDHVVLGAQVGGFPRTQALTWLPPGW